MDETPEVEREPRICNWTGCSKLFTPRRTDTKYCSAGCRNAAWLAAHPRVQDVLVACPSCGGTFHIVDRKVKKRKVKKEAKR